VFEVGVSLDSPLFKGNDGKLWMEIFSEASPCCPEILSCERSITTTGGSLSLAGFRPSDAVSCFSARSSPSLSSSASFCFFHSSKLTKSSLASSFVLSDRVGASASVLAGRVWAAKVNVGSALGTVVDADVDDLSTEVVSVTLPVSLSVTGSAFTISGGMRCDHPGRKSDHMSGTDMSFFAYERDLDVAATRRVTSEVEKVSGEVAEESECWDAGSGIEVA
jgi:hypothetical protein